MNTKMTSGPMEPGAAASPGSRWALAGLALSILLASFNSSIVNVALPALTEVFATSLAAVQWTVLAYLLAITVLVVGAGRLGDIFGRQRVLLVGVGVFTLAAGLCGAAPTLGWAIAARFVQGAGAAVMMALALALAGETVSRHGAGRAIGLLGTMSALGTALGPVLGGFLIASFGWRAIFLVNLPLGFAAFLLLRRHVPVENEDANAARGRFDGAGMRRLAVALRARLAMSLLVASVLMATLVVGPFYLMDALALPAATVGLLLSIGPFVAAATGVPAGRLVERVGAGPAAVGGLLGIAAGCGALWLSPTSWGVAGYIVPMLAMTAGYAVFQTANNTAVMSGAGAGQRGVVSGLLHLSRNLGLMVGTAVLGAVFTRASLAADGGGSGPAATVAGMRATFAVALLPVAAALLLAVRDWGRRGVPASGATPRGVPVPAIGGGGGGEPSPSFGMTRQASEAGGTRLGDNAPPPWRPEQPGKKALAARERPGHPPFLAAIDGTSIPARPCR